MNQYIIAGCVIAIGFFMPLLCYRKGIKEGYELAKGKTPEPIKTPVKVVQDVIKGKKEEKETNEFYEGLSNILNYDGNPQGGEK